MITEVVEDRTCHYNIKVSLDDAPISFPHFLFLILLPSSFFLACIVPLGCSSPLILPLYCVLHVGRVCAGLQLTLARTQGQEGEAIYRCWQPCACS
jgi:hypothetical protein